MKRSNDPHTFARPEEAVVKHLSLNLTVDFSKKTVSGAATLKYESASDAKQIIVDIRGLSIANVTAEGEKLNYKLGAEEPYKGIPLIIDLPTKNKLITIQYSSSPDAAAVQWLTPEQTAGKKYPFLFTQSEAILARTWIPIQDSPGIRFTYDATIHVPADLMALMSAENPQTKNATGTYHFNMPQPIPAYLLALAVGNVEFKL